MRKLTSQSHGPYSDFVINFYRCTSFVLILALGCNGSAKQESEPDVGDAPETTEADIPPRPQCDPVVLTESVHYAPGQACRQGAPMPGIFTESAAQLGIHFVHNGFPPPDRHSNTDWGLEDFAGVAIADLDHDGLLDIYFTNGGDSDHLYLSLCQEIGRYYLKTLNGKNTSRVVSAADLDGDGDRDLAIVTQSEPVWRENDGLGVFGAPSPLIAAKADITYSTFSLALGDLTGDGLLDIYLGNHEEYGAGNTPPMPGHEQLLVNQGDGVFENQSSWIPKLAIDDLTFIAALIDLDNDGDLDVYEVNDAVPFKQLGLPNFPGFGEGAGNRLLRNDGMQNGQLKLVDVTQGSGADVVIPGMGVAVGDYDNDGLVDLYVSAMLPDPNALLHNDGDLKFSNTTVAMNADTMTGEHDVAWGTVFFDADMDGWLDLFVIHGFKETWVPELRTNRDDQANVLLKNLQGKGFEEISVEAGVAGKGWSRSPAVGDLNRDGFPDLIVGNTDEAPYVYLNGCDGRPWLTVRLNKSGPNVDGIGARIVVKSNELSQTRIINPGSHGLYGSSAPEAYFGFPEGTSKVTVTVHWPDKTTSEWPDTAVKQIMTIRQ